MGKSDDVLPGSIRRPTLARLVRQFVSESDCLAAFLGWTKLPFACQGPWKMFGNPSASLGLAEAFRACRRNMAEQLATAQSALDCIVPSSPSPNPHFFAL